MYLSFAWRYFKGKKSAHAINIISWVTTAVIAFATCCQVLVLSVFNGFESLVKSMYSSFYTDLKLVPVKGKTLHLSPGQLASIKAQPYIGQLSTIVEETALMQYDEQQTTIKLKGVDRSYPQVSGVAEKTNRGQFHIGNTSEPEMVIGAGVQYSSGIIISDAYAPEAVTVILPKKKETGSDPLQAISEGVLHVSGSFAIQQEFDNLYAITNTGFMQQQMNLDADEFSAVEIKLKPGYNLEESQSSLQQFLGNTCTVQTRYQQNSSLYNTMKTEKWAIYAILTLILIIAAFNMVSALTMLVLEKKQDISILLSMGSSPSQIRKIFLSEGLLLGILGTAIGIGLATAICLFQLKFKKIKLTGSSFLIDYFPVKMVMSDFLLVAGTAMAIALLAAWFPARKAGKQMVSLR